MVAIVKSLAERQIVRFLLLGGLAAAVNWLVRFPLSGILPLGAAVIAAYLIGMSVGFCLYRRYVFPGSDRPLLQQTIVFVAVNLVGGTVVLALTHAFMALQSGLGHSTLAKEALAHGLAIGIGAGVSFVGHKTLTFSLSKPRPRYQRN